MQTLYSGRRSQLMVTGQQPSAEGDTIGLVVEFLRVNLVKMIQLALFQDLRMNCCHTVDAVTVMDVDVCHVHSLILVNDLNFFVLIFLCHTVTQLLDDGNQLRNYLPQYKPEATSPELLPGWCGWYKRRCGLRRQWLHPW